MRAMRTYSQATCGPGDALRNAQRNTCPRQHVSSLSLVRCPCFSYYVLRKLGDTGNKISLEKPIDNNDRQISWRGREKERKEKEERKKESRFHSEDWPVAQLAATFFLVRNGRTYCANNNSNNRMGINSRAILNRVNNGCLIAFLAGIASRVGFSVSINSLSSAKLDRRKRYGDKNIRYTEGNIKM